MMLANNLVIFFYYIRYINMNKYVIYINFLNSNVMVKLKLEYKDKKEVKSRY